MAADAGDDIGGAHRIANHLGHGEQDVVAHFVALAVVDVAQPFEPNQKYATRTLSELMFELADESPSVEQPRMRVAVGQTLTARAARDLPSTVPRAPRRAPQRTPGHGVTARSPTLPSTPPTRASSTAPPSWTSTPAEWVAEGAGCAPGARVAPWRRPCIATGQQPSGSRGRPQVRSKRLYVGRLVRAPQYASQRPQRVIGQRPHCGLGYSENGGSLDRRPTAIVDLDDDVSMLLVQRQQRPRRDQLPDLVVECCPADNLCQARLRSSTDRLPTPLSWAPPRQIAGAASAHDRAAHAPKVSRSVARSLGLKAQSVAEAGPSSRRFTVAISP